MIDRSNLAFQRAALPELLFVPDLALALQCSPTAARRAIRRGECGPYVRLGRRYAVLRATFIDAIERQAASVHTLEIASAVEVRP
jgi:hypothetical protein